MIIVVATLDFENQANVQFLTKFCPITITQHLRVRNHAQQADNAASRVAAADGAHRQAE